MESAGWWLEDCFRLRLEGGTGETSSDSVSLGIKVDCLAAEEATGLRIDSGEEEEDAACWWSRES